MFAFAGGNLRNAIARESFAVITFPEQYKENVRVDFNIYSAEMENVWKITEPGLQLALESTDVPENVLTKESTDALVNALYACPHGVFSMSYRMPGLVETSTNLAAVRFNEPNNILITTSQRSDVNSEKFNIANMVESVFTLAGTKVEHGEGYPGWAPNPDSPVVKVAVDSYKRLFGNEPIVRSIHAGLECGFVPRNNLNMIYFLTIIGEVSTLDEKKSISRRYRCVVEPLGVIYYKSVKRKSVRSVKFAEVRTISLILYLKTFRRIFYEPYNL